MSPMSPRQLHPSTALLGPSLPTMSTSSTPRMPPDAGSTDLGTMLYDAAAIGQSAAVRQLLYSKHDIIHWAPQLPSSLYVASCNGHLEVVQTLIAAGVTIGLATNQYVKATPLGAAACNGHLEVMQCLVDAGADINALSENGMSPLAAAASTGHLACVRYLCEIRADLEHCGAKGITPLVAATCHGNLVVAQYLVRQGASLTDYPLVHMAAFSGHLGVVRLLAEAKADVMHPDHVGTTAIYAAAFHGHLEVVKYLVEVGVNKEVATPEGAAPAHAAAFNGHLEVLQYLVSIKASVLIRDNRGRAPIHAAAQNNKVHIVKYLVHTLGIDKDLQDGDGYTALFMASCVNRLNALNFLLQAKADCDASNARQYRPLHVAARSGHLEVVNALVGAGAHLDRPDISGSAPLHCAAVEGHVEIVQALANFGAKVDKRDARGVTPLAAAAGAGHLGVVKVLIEARGNLDTVDARGVSMVHCAAFNGKLDVLKFLLEGSGPTKLLTGCTVPSPHRPKIPPPMQFAAARGHLDVVKFFVRRLADIGMKVPDILEQCAMAASTYGHSLVQTYLQMVKDWGPLHLACEDRDVPFIITLLRSGADPQQSTSNGLTAVQVAKCIVTKEVCADTLVVMQRSCVWSPRAHCLFPEPFRRSVTHLMATYDQMCGAAHDLPLELWFDILSFLPRDLDWQRGICDATARSMQ